MNRDSLGRFYSEEPFKVRDELYTYNSWYNMMKRCYEKTNNRYKYYGGKGIKVCDEWRNFSNFILTMGIRPKNTTLDRIDISKDYCFSNCVWSDAKTQANNKSNTIYITHLSKTKPLKQWCEELDLDYKTIFSRYKYIKIKDSNLLFSTKCLRNGRNPACQSI